MLGPRWILRAFNDGLQFLLFLLRYFKSIECLLKIVHKGNLPTLGR